MLKVIDDSIDTRANYASVHVVKAMLLLGKRMQGRESLMKELMLNEASAKTLLKNLEKKALIKSGYTGSCLTKKGLGFVALFNEKISGPAEIAITGITMSDYNIAYLVRNAAPRIKKGVEQRDQAILMGADGLTTLVYRKKLFMPGLEKWKIPPELKNIFALKENDIILIGSAKNQRKADLAALNAAINLLR